MSLRRIARPLINIGQWFYRHPAVRRLMIEFREEFDDRVAVLSNPPLSLHVASRMENQRAVTFLSKEPDTITWLDQLRKDDLFVDIGANIGVYTLYAATKCDAHVIAFEPEAQNFAALIRNLATNPGGNRVDPWPIAVSDATRPVHLFLSGIQTGGSHHTAGAPIDELGRPFKPHYVQGTMAMALDEALDVIAKGRCPRFIKVDVDGNEALVVAGMQKILGDRRLEQILIEMAAEPSDAPELYAQLASAGFAARSPEWINKGRGNVIFVRQSLDSTRPISQ